MCEPVPEYNENDMKNFFLFVSATLFVLMGAWGCSDSDDDGDGGGVQTVPAEGLTVKISSVSPIRAYYRIEYSHPENFTDPDDYLVAGMCYGKSPHPTVYDNSTSTGVVRPNSDSYSATDLLEPNTTYYFRAYREFGNSIIYSKETSVKTPGTTDDSDIKLVLHLVSENTMKAEYRINAKGRYKVELSTWDLQGWYTPYDCGYKSEGDGDEFLYTWNGQWGNRRYFVLSAKDVETGIEYNSYELYK